MNSKLTREKVQWLHDAAEEAAAVGMKLTMKPDEILMFTSSILAAMDSEPVTWINGCNKSVPTALRYLAENPRPIGGESSFNTAHLYQLAREIELMAEAPLYRHAQQPVVRPAPECQHQWRCGGANKLQNQKQCIKCGRVELDAQPAPVVPDAYVRDERGRMMLNGVCEPKIGFGAGWNACRAAMLQGAENAEPRCGNSPVIPEGYVMVPKEPTEAMINAWLSEVANWRGHVAGYKAMLAAAPQEMMKDEANNLSQK